MQSAVNSASWSGDYVLDSYALFIFFQSEPGFEQLRSLLESAQGGKCRLYLCVVNLGEVLGYWRPGISQDQAGKQCAHRMAEVLAWLAGSQ